MRRFDKCKISKGSWQGVGELVVEAKYGALLKLRNPRLLILNSSLKIVKSTISAHIADIVPPGFPEIVTEKEWFPCMEKSDRADAWKDRSGL